MSTAVRRTTRLPAPPAATYEADDSRRRRPVPSPDPRATDRLGDRPRPARAADLWRRCRGPRHRQRHVSGAEGHSTAVLQPACEGAIPPLDVALFADTG